MISVKKTQVVTEQLTIPDYLVYVGLKAVSSPKYRLLQVIRYDRVADDKSEVGVIIGIEYRIADSTDPNKSYWRYTIRYAAEQNIFDSGHIYNVQLPEDCITEVLI